MIQKKCKSCICKKRCGICFVKNEHVEELSIEEVFTCWFWRDGNGNTEFMAEWCDEEEEDAVEGGLL